MRITKQKLFKSQLFYTHLKEGGSGILSSAETDMQKTIRQIADELGVSPSSVSIVLNSKPGVSDETRALIRDALIQNGRTIKTVPAVVPKPANRVFRFLYYRSSTDWIAMRKDDFFLRILSGLESGSKKYNYTFSIANTTDTELPAALEQAAADGVSGIIFLGTEYSDATISCLENASIPFVCIDRPFPTASMNTVHVNNQLGIYDSLHHLFALGHRRIHYLSTVSTSACLPDREFYYSSIMRVEGFSEDCIRIIHLDLLPDVITASFTEYLETTPSEELPTAFIAANDVIAVTVMNILLSKGYRIPEDFSIIGFDDASVATMVKPFLTTIHSPLEEIGEISVRRLNDMNNGAESSLKIEVAPYLVKRETTTAPSRQKIKSKIRQRGDDAQQYTLPCTAENRPPWYTNL